MRIYTPRLPPPHFFIVVIKHGKLCVWFFFIFIIMININNDNDDKNTIRTEQKNNIYKYVKISHETVKVCDLNKRGLRWLLSQWWKPHSCTTVNSYLVYICFNSFFLFFSLPFYLILIRVSNICIKVNTIIGIVVFVVIVIKVSTFETFNMIKQQYKNFLVFSLLSLLLCVYE